MTQLKQYCVFLGCYIDNFNFAGGDLSSEASDQSKARDANTCQIECFYKNGCNYWTFDKDSSKCWLKRELIKATAHSKYRSGPKKCLVQSETEKELDNASCMENNGVNLEGTSFFVFPTYSKDPCGWECQRNNKCKAFTYANGVIFKRIIM